MSYYDHYEHKTIRELHDEEQYEAECRDRHYEGDDGGALKRQELILGLILFCAGLFILFMMVRSAFLQ